VLSWKASAGDFGTMSRSALGDAIRENDLAKVEGLVADGADVKEVYIYNYTALFLQAADYGHTIHQSCTGS
jgi:hypothetical protein